MDRNVVLSFDRITKSYADGTVAIQELTLEIEQGEFVVLIGPSGCGKTTTLKLINRLEDPTSGRIRLEGKDIQTIDPVRLRRGIGYVIQETGLMPHLTVEENIAMVPRLHKWSRKRIVERVEYLLKLAGLDPALYRYRLPSQLSGGQRQRIGVLRALAAEPDVVLMDEPFGALDPITRDKLQSELIELQKKLKKTIVFVTHDIDEALKLADRVVLLRKGRIEQLGTPQELQENPKNEFVQNFIGEDRLSQISPDTSVETLIEDAYLTLTPDTPAGSALEQMEETNLESAQLVDSRGKWHGMLTLNDVKRAAGRNSPLRSIAILDRKLSVEDATIRDAAEMLVDDWKPIPILDGNGRFLGRITNSGIARLTISRLTRSRIGGRPADTAPQPAMTPAPADGSVMKEATHG